jgi:hypothetical protein
LAAAAGLKNVEDSKPEVVAVDAIQKWIADTCRNAKMQSALNEYDKGRQAIMDKFMPPPQIVAIDGGMPGLPAQVNLV